MNKKLIASNIICEKTNNIFSYRFISYTYSNKNKLCFSIKLKVKFLCFWITIWEGNFYDNEDLTYKNTRAIYYWKAAELIELLSTDKDVKSLYKDYTDFYHKYYNIDNK